VLSILRYMVPAMGILLMFGAVSLTSAFAAGGELVRKRKAKASPTRAQPLAKI